MKSENGTTGAEQRNEIAAAQYFDLMIGVFALQKGIESTQFAFAQRLKLTAPQLMILHTIERMDRGEGVPGVDLAQTLKVDPSFISSQTAQLMQDNFVRRSPSTKDGRVVLLSLTDEACDALSAVGRSSAALRQLIFEKFNDRDLATLMKDIDLLASLHRKMQKLLAIEE